MDETSTPSPAAAAPSKNIVIVSWVVRIIAAAMFAMAAATKLTGQEDAIAIFETIGVDPWGRLGTGAMEALAIILLLVPKTAFYGGVLGIVIMVGAIGSHFAYLGIDLGKAFPDSPDISMFIMAIVVLAACVTTTYLHFGGKLGRSG